MKILKNKFFCLFIIFLTITSGVSLVSAENATEQDPKLTIETTEEEKIKNESERIGENVTVKEDGYLNISFDDDYNGYCINKGWKGATSGENFTVQNTSSAVNSNTGKEIGNYIKILFVDFHDEVTKNDRLTQNVIWSFSNNYYSHDYMDIVEKVIKIAESGRVIADHGETININNTTKATFDFEVLSSGDYGYQNFFGYKISYSDIINKIPILGSNNENSNNSIEEIPKQDTNNNIEEIPLFSATFINNTTNESQTENITENKNNETQNKSVDENNININTTNNDSENNTLAGEIDLKKHVTGYSTIFAILVILMLGVVLAIKVKNGKN